MPRDFAVGEGSEIRGIRPPWPPKRMQIRRSPEVQTGLWPLALWDCAILRGQPSVGRGRLTARPGKTDGSIVRSKAIRATGNRSDKSCALSSFARDSYNELRNGQTGTCKSSISARHSLMRSKNYSRKKPAIGGKIFIG